MIKFSISFSQKVELKTVRTTEDIVKLQNRFSAFFLLLVFTNFFAAAWSPYLHTKNETSSSRDVSGKEEKYEVQNLETLTSQLTKHHPFG